ncbi:metalloregulator ArsR/SmtB family transcription factor [Mycoplasmopsis sturni]|uniref:metalloregulator ArsR/SmtB family transcription factor n=1 Tax=Mycoplasmopsis sturni TaxID=39047 RepID=UPI00055FAF05|nr:metalloregulator ArsR/SmtB family transcription factor [Mycoplasmopsis sturni]
MKETVLFKYLSSDAKLRIIVHLYMCNKAECNVQTLSKILSLKQANLSKHLASLRNANIVKTKTEGIFSYYQLSKTFCSKYHTILDWLVKQPKLEKYACSCNDLHVHSH